MASQRLRLVALWCVASALLVAVIYPAGGWALRGQLEEAVRRHLLLTLDESYFSSAQNRVDDRAALARIGGAINRDLQGIVQDRIFAPHRDCAVELQRIDGVAIDARPLPWQLAFSLPRNQIERPVQLGVACAVNPLPGAAAALLLGALFVLIAARVPPPLGRAQRRWIGQLTAQGYSAARAFELVSACGAAQLDLNPAQQRCLERLHDPARGNFERALAIAADARVAVLDATGLDWLALGLQRQPGDLTAALQLAAAPDTVDIDLRAMTLHLHSLPVPMGGTPFFYYAWYAMQRRDGDGWVTNPASNRPDRAVGGELAALMERYDGHARAINDLRQAGLKARTLDQNRSKIKEDIVAVLGETLAEAFLFEASRHPDGSHTRYRLRVEGPLITLRS